MWGKSLSRARLIYSTTSSHSGKINVWQKGRERILKVGGYTQSINGEVGNLEDRVWGRVVEELAKRVADPESALILGLGGGTEAKLLAERFPGIIVDGVELDPVIVEVGKRFFGLDEISNLQIIVADAIKVVKKPRDYPLRTSQYSMIIVDVYVGDSSPLALEEQEVLVGIKTLLSSASEKASPSKARTVHSQRGMAVFNRLSQLASPEFRAKLEDVFGNLEEVGVTYGWGLPPGNVLYLCS